MKREIEDPCWIEKEKMPNSRTFTRIRAEASQREQMPTPDSIQTKKSFILYKEGHNAGRGKR